MLPHRVAVNAFHGGGTLRTAFTIDGDIGSAVRTIYTIDAIRGEVVTVAMWRSSGTTGNRIGGTSNGSSGVVDQRWWCKQSMPLYHSFHKSSMLVPLVQKVQKKDTCVGGNAVGDKGTAGRQQWPMQCDVYTKSLSESAGR